MKLESNFIDFLINTYFKNNLVHYINMNYKRTCNFCLKHFFFFGRTYG